MMIGKVNGVSVQYQGKTPCFAPISFDLFNSSIYWVKGKSGIGKSSLFHAMCHCIPEHIPAKVFGEIDYGTQSLQSLSHVERVHTFGLVFQQPHWQFATTQVESELAFVLESLNVQPLQIKQRIDQLLKELNIESLRSMSLHHCSLGQQQLIAFASVLIAQPKVLFLDEAFSAIEPAKKRELIEYLNQRKGNMTLLIIDHDEHATWDVDEVIWLKPWKTSTD